MISSLKLFQAYPEINGGILANKTTRVKAKALSLALDTQHIPIEVSIQLPISPNHSIWEDRSNKIVTTPVSNPSGTITCSYKSVVTNLITRVSPPSANQTGTYQQGQKQDLDKSDTQSTRFESSEISETKTI